MKSCYLLEVARVRGATPLLVKCLTVAAFATSLASPLLGQFVYVTDYGSGVSGYTINPTTGALTAITGSPFATAGTHPSYSVAIDPTGHFAYMANAGGTISGFAINSTTGALTPITGSPFPAGTNPLSLAIDPTGKFAYVADGGGDGVWGYRIDPITGVLTPITGSPFAPAGLYEPSVAVDPTGTFVYVANAGGGILGYTINPATGALTPITGSPFPAGTNPYSVAVDPTGRFAYVANLGNSGGGSVSGYTINPATGALTAITGSPFQAGYFPYSVAIDPGGQFVYVANLGYLANYGSGVSGYTINPTTGALTPITGSPFPAGTNLFAVAVDPTGQFAYVTNRNSYGGWLSGFTINPTTGALTAITGSPFPTAGTYPLAVAVTACMTPPSITAISASPDVLWPPNNKMVDVSINYEVTARCGAPACALSVTSNEPLTGTSDWTVVGPHDVQLRASRNGNGSGRIYTVTVTCQDTRGNASSNPTTVLVPHDQSKGK